MTRKSKRELRRELEDLESDAPDALGWAEALKWLQHVEHHGREADPIAAYFGRDEVAWAPGLVALIQDAVADDQGLERCTPAEIIGLRYMAPAVGKAIAERRAAAGKEGPDR